MASLARRSRHAASPSRDAARRSTHRALHARGDRHYAQAEVLARYGWDEPRLSDAIGEKRSRFSFPTAKRRTPVEGEELMDRAHWKLEWRLRDLEQWDARILEAAASIPKKR